MDSRLIAWLDEPNLVDIVDDMEGGHDILIKIGREVVNGDASDLKTMSTWVDVLTCGMDLMEPDNKTTDYPWELASNYKSPEIGTAVRDFGDKYKTQIMSKPNLVAGSIEGNNNQEKKVIEDRIISHMNYQLNTENKSWREDQKSLGYQVAAQGSIFKKTWYDPSCGHNVSEIISHPNFSLDNDCSKFDDLERFTQKKYYSPNKIFERTQSKVWSEFELPKKTDSEDKDQYIFLEQMCFYDLDDDGYKEPYLITVHQQSNKVVRIVPRWNINGIMVDYKGSTMSYAEMQARIDSIEKSLLHSDRQHADFIADTKKKSDSNATLISIRPIEMITPYNFIDPSNGKILSYGFCHIMVSGVKGVNKTTNTLFNSGDLATLQGGFLSKEHRSKKKGVSSFKPGMWKVTNIDAMSLQNSILALPLKEPSPTLFSLNEGLKGELKELGTKVNIEGMMSPNIPAASVLGMLQEGSIPTSALMDNMVSSMSKEFTIMFELNKQFTDPVNYLKVNDGEGDYKTDYNTEIIIRPTANAKFSSQLQNIQTAQVQLDQIPLVLQAGANAAPIVRNYFDAIESTLTEEIFSQEVSEEDKKFNDQMLKSQKATEAAQQAQTELLEKQYALMQREQDVKEREQQAKEREGDEKLRLQQKKQEDDFSLKLTEMEETFKKRLDESVLSHKDLQIKYETLIDKRQQQVIR